MSDINIAKNLIKRKVHINDLACNVPTEKYEGIELLIIESDECLKAIKTKIKLKSQLTQKFKSHLEEHQRQALKTQVGEVSGSIKNLESEL